MRGTRGLPALDLYDIAYLAGGPQRVAEAALLALRDRGVITISGPRVRAEEGPAADHPVERSLVALCRDGKSVTLVLTTLRSGLAVEQMGRRLVRRGLLRRSRRRPTRAGRRRLKAARRKQNLPAYVFDGAAAVTDRMLRRTIKDVPPIPSGLGRSLIRLGKRLDHDHDSDSDAGNADAGHGFDGGGGGGSD